MNTQIGKIKNTITCIEGQLELIANNAAAIIALEMLETLKKEFKELENILKEGE